MSGGAPGGYDGDMHPTPIPLRITCTVRLLDPLNPVDFLQEIGHRTTGERDLGEGALALLIPVQPLALVHAFG